MLWRWDAFPGACVPLCVCLSDESPCFELLHEFDGRLFVEMHDPREIPVSHSWLVQFQCSAHLGRDDCGEASGWKGVCVGGECRSSGRRWHDFDWVADGCKQFRRDVPHKTVKGLCHAWRMADVAAFSLIKLDDEPLAIHADHHAPLAQCADTSVRDDFRADILAVPLDVVIEVR